MTRWCTRIACWIPKATNTHSGCVILISFQLQQWLTNGPQCYVIRTLSVTISKVMHSGCYKLHSVVQVTKAGIIS
jgi:hypothetical protein